MDYRGRWALVTGASAGIGAEFARQLARAGAHVALTARRQTRLDELAAELRRKHGVETRAIAADLSDPAAPDEVLRTLNSDAIAVDILINNAGYGLPGRFENTPWSAHRDFLEVMTSSYAHFVRLVLPGMKERGFGRIVQVSSVAGLVPGSAGHTMYGATKAFLISFSQSLAAESEGTGIHVSALCPGFTYSEFHDVNGTRALVSKLPKYMFQRAEPVVEGALRAVEKNHVVYVPGAWNKFVVWLMKVLPRSLAAAMVKRQSKGFRKQ